MSLTISSIPLDVFLLITDFLPCGSLASLGATSSGLRERLQPILLKNASTDPELGLKAMAFAAQNGNIGVVKTLLELGVSVNCRWPNSGLTPLHLAAVQGHRNLVRLLLERGADPLARTENGCTALHLAVRMGRVAATGALLEDRRVKAGLNNTSLGGLAILMFAVQHALSIPPENQQSVYRDYQTVFQRDGEDELPRMMECGGGYGHCVRPVIVNMLIRAGADVNLRCKSSSDAVSALHFAVGLHGCAQAARILIEKGADIEAAGSTRRTPLFTACERPGAGTVKLLLNAGASVKARAMVYSLRVPRFDGGGPVLRVFRDLTRKPPTPFEHAIAYGNFRAAKEIFHKLPLRRLMAWKVREVVTGKDLRKRCKEGRNVRRLLPQPLGLHDSRNGFY